MWYDDPETNKFFYLVGMTLDEDFEGYAIDFERDGNNCVIIVKNTLKKENSIEYIRYSVMRNDNLINITKENDNEVVNYQLLFKKIINRFFCMVSSNGNKVAFYEFNVDFLNTLGATFDNIVHNVDYFDNRNRGRK